MTLKLSKHLILTYGYDPKVRSCHATSPNLSFTQRVVKGLHIGLVRIGRKS